MNPDGERFAVELSPAAQRDLRRLDALTVARVRTPILSLGSDPRPAGATKLVGSEFWRLRAGDMRVVYAIDETHRLVVFLRVAHRSERTYRRLRR